MSKNTLLKMVKSCFPIVINDIDFVLSLDRTGAYLFTADNSEQVAIKAFQLIDTLALTKDQAVLIIVSEGEEGHTGFSYSVLKENLRPLILELVQKRCISLSSAEIKEINSCYSLPAVKKEEKEEIEYHSTVLFHKLKQYGKQTKRRYGRNVLPDSLCNILVENRPTTIREITALGVDSESAVDVISIIETTNTAKVSKIGLAGRLFQGISSSVIDQAARQHALTGWCLLLVSVILIAVKGPWWCSLIFASCAVYYGALSCKIVTCVLGGVCRVGALICIAINLIPIIRIFIMWFVKIQQ